MHGRDYCTVWVKFANKKVVSVVYVVLVSCGTRLRSRGYGLWISNTC